MTKKKTEASSPDRESAVGILMGILWRWVVPVVAFVVGGVVGLIVSGYSVPKLFFRGVEVDLTNSEAVAEALRNESETNWVTYFVFGSNTWISLPGWHWGATIPIGLAFLFFLVAFVVTTRIGGRQRTGR